MPQGKDKPKGGATGPAQRPTRAAAATDRLRGKDREKRTGSKETR